LIARIGNPCHIQKGEAEKRSRRNLRKGERKHMSATETKKATAAFFEAVAGPFDARPSLGKTEAKPAWKVALDCLLIVWAVISVAVAILVIALFVPGHLGLGDLLQALGNVLPPDFPFCTT
jgi:hypothetical protein